MENEEKCGTNLNRGKDRKHINYKRLREDKEQCLQDVPGEGKIDNEK